MTNAPHFSLNEEQDALNIDFPTDPPCRMTLNADELDVMIENLGKMRAAMKPYVDMDAGLDPGSRVTLFSVGRWHIEPMKDGRFGTMLLSPGFRWVGFPLERSGLEYMYSEIRRLLDRKS